MDNHSNNVTRMLKTCDKTFDDFNEIWDDIIAFKKYVLQFKEFIAGIGENEIILSGIDAGPSKQKDIFRASMIRFTLKMAGIGYCYADDTEDAVLKEKMDIHISYFSHLTDDEQTAKAEMVYNLLNPLVIATPNVLADYGVLPANMVDFKDCITTFKDYILNPKSVSLSGSEAKKNIKAFNKKGQALLKKTDKFMENFLEENHDFYDTYFRSRVIYDYGHRFKKPISVSAGKVLVLDTQIAIPQAKIYFVGFEKKFVLSDNLGNFNIGCYQIGNMMLVAEKVEFNKVQKLMVVVKDENQHFNIEMKPVSENPPPPES